MAALGTAHAIAQAFSKKKVMAAFRRMLEGGGDKATAGDSNMMSRLRDRINQAMDLGKRRKK